MAVRKFRIRVNGAVYDVEAEEIQTQGTPVLAEPPAPQTPAPQPVVQAEVVRKPAAAVLQNGETVIEAPLPGTVLDVKVEDGGLVEIGQVLVILEAMKMENEVTSPVAGRVTNLKVHKGSAVDANQVLLTIDGR